MSIERYRAGRESSALGMIFGAVLVAASGLAALWLHLGLPQPVCPFHALTGVPCPTCGSVRMVENLLGGHVAEAFTWNPLVFVGLLAVALWSVISALRKVLDLPSWRLVVDDRERLVFRLTAVVLIAVNWVYLIWRGV